MNTLCTNDARKKYYPYADETYFHVVCTCCAAQLGFSRAYVLFSSKEYALGTVLHGGRGQYSQEITLKQEGTVALHLNDFMLRVDRMHNDQFANHIAADRGEYRTKMAVMH